MGFEYGYGSFAGLWYQENGIKQDFLCEPGNSHGGINDSSDRSNAAMHRGIGWRKKSSRSHRAMIIIIDTIISYYEMQLPFLHRWFHNTSLSLRSKYFIDLFFSGFRTEAAAWLQRLEAESQRGRERTR